MNHSNTSPSCATECCHNMLPQGSNKVITCAHGRLLCLLCKAACSRLYNMCKLGGLPYGIMWGSCQSHHRQHQAFKAPSSATASSPSSWFLGAGVQEAPVLHMTSVHWHCVQGNKEGTRTQTVLVDWCQSRAGATCTPRDTNMQDVLAYVVNIRSMFMLSSSSRSVKNVCNML